MLENLKVVAVEHLVSAPFATRMLSDLGAEVIKIEHVKGGDQYRHSRQYYDPEEYWDMTYTFLQYNRGKQSIALDLKTPEGKEIFNSLASKADVIVENLSTGAMDRLGLGYDSMRELNPDIVYCSISGYGETGPHKERGAVDPLIQMMSGLADQNSTYTDGPALSGIFIADFMGSMYATISMLTALYRGEGTKIDVSMMDALVSLFHHEVAEYSATGDAPPRQRSSSVPQGIFDTEDGALGLLVRGAGAWPRFCELMGFEDWLESGELDELNVRQKLDNRERINNRVQDRFLSKPTQYWIEMFEDEDIYAVPVRSVVDAFEDEAIHIRNILREGHDEELGSYYWLNFPALFSDYEVPSADAPRFSEHTDEILADLGYSEEEIKSLYNRGVTVDREGISSGKDDN